MSPEHSADSRLDLVLRTATWGGDHASAGRILASAPDIGARNLYAAVATGDLQAVGRYLAADEDAASRKGGPLGREPLLYLAYGRLPGGESNGPAIAAALLDHGADPDVQWLDDWNNAFTVLTGVIGEGEGDQPPHPQARELAALLIERGADPYDKQALYNTSITRDDVTWLDILWSACERAGVLEKWRGVPDDNRIGGVLSLSALDYLLGNAVAHNHLARAEWLLRHGANPNGPHAYSKRPLREEALIHGNQAMAALLERFGAEARALEGRTAFQAACMGLDASAARELVASDPSCLRDSHTMLTAARAGRTDVVSLLLDLGMDVDVADWTQQRGLQNAVMSGSLELVKLLVTRGADVDRPTTQYGGAMGFAAHFGRREIAAYLAPLSRDVWNLVHLGMKDRLAELFAEDPALVNAPHFRVGAPPLFWLPDDDSAAADMTSFLLAHGATTNVRNKDGLTPEQLARQRGLTRAADLMVS